MTAEDPVFQSIARSTPLFARSTLRTQHVRRPLPPKTRLRFVLLSFLQWNLTHARWRLWNLLDTLRGRGTLEQKAVRLGQAIERMGATGVKVGQQVAMRIDLMPLEFSLALSSMDDRRPPMDLREATIRIERATGAPLTEVFEVFDPEPISSTTAFCIYQATVKGGAPVAVKVRREGVRNRLSADLVAVSWILWVLERSTIYRPGFFASMSQELLQLANDRLDLYQQARYQTVFQRMARRDGPAWVTSPRVYHHLSNHAVLVSDFATGVPLSEVVRAAQEQDPAGLLKLASIDIDPRIVGQRLLHAAWWAAFENLFFVSGASSENIIVQPGNRLVFVDFEDSGTLSTSQKRQFQEVLVRLGQSDVSGAARSLVQVLSPLPFIDVFDFAKRIESGLWQELLALRDEEAEWWERTTIGLWRTVMRAARHDGVTVRLDVLRFMASSLSYDTLAARLIPDLDLLRQFDRYRRAADQRAARRYRRELDRLEPDDVQAAMVARVARASEGLSRLALWVEATVDNLPIANLALSGKAAYAVSQLVRLTAVCAALLAVGVAVQLVAGRSMDVVGAIAAVGGNAWFGLAACVLVIVAIRRVLFRLDDKGT